MLSSEIESPVIRETSGVFGALAQYERALTKERIMAGLKSAKQRGKTGGRPRVISLEKMQAISEALKSGTSKATICRTFNVKRTTLYDNLDEIHRCL